MSFRLFSLKPYFLMESFCRLFSLRPHTNKDSDRVKTFSVFTKRNKKITTVVI